MSVRRGDHIPYESDSLITHSTIGYCVPGNPLGHPVVSQIVHLQIYTDMCLELCVLIYTVS